MTQATSEYLNRPRRTFAECELAREAKAVEYYNCAICGEVHTTSWREADNKE